ncbi:MAG: hypothetical protein WCB44_01465, partial [Stellaceae bacterium]
KRAERTSRHCVKYFFSISGVSGARNALKPVEWNEIGNRHSAAAAFPADRQTTGKFFVSAPIIGPLEPKISRGIKLL